MKRRIDFQKLIDGDYPLDIELEVFNWMLATGRKYDTPRTGYYHSGMDKVMYGYSANTHDSYTDFGRDFRRTLQLGFVNTLVKTPIPSVRAWREAERVGLGKYRMFVFPEERPFRGWDLYREIVGIYEYEGRLLKKEYFHPEYQDRTEPRIVRMNFSTAGMGYRIRLAFTFKGCEDSGWDQYFHQQEGESIDIFIHRFHREMSQLLVPQVSINQANEILQSVSISRLRLYPVEDIMKALRNGADPNIANDHGIPLLHNACKAGDVDVARLLLFYGADVNAKDKDGWTPLHFACFPGRTDTVRLLIEAGADVNARDKENISVLEQACCSSRGRLQRMVALIEAGADPNGDTVVHDEAGRPCTPLDIAIENADPDHVETRERIIDWYREHHPDLVMEKWCTTPGPTQ